MATKISTISNALLLIGDKPINSLDEGSYRAQVAAGLYDSIYEAELASHPWYFARKLVQLAQTTSASEIDQWRYIYQLPTDMITLYRVYPSSDYEIYGDKLYTNANSLTLDYTQKVPESLWPGYFEKLMQRALAKDFIIPIREDVNASQIVWQQYLGEGQKARAEDSKQKIQRPIQSQPFIQVRFGKDFAQR